MKGRDGAGNEDRRGEGGGGNLQFFNKVTEAYRIFSAATINFCGNNLKG